MPGQATCGPVRWSDWRWRDGRIPASRQLGFLDPSLLPAGHRVDRTILEPLAIVAVRMTRDGASASELVTHAGVEHPPLQGCPGIGRPSPFRRAGGQHQRIVRRLAGVENVLRVHEHPRVADAMLDE